jgi:hypothetical protein
MKLFSLPLCRRLLPLLTALLLAVSASGAATTAGEYNLDRNRSPQENWLSLIFGSAPPLATQRGILVIDAFADLNGNGRRDPGETDLGGQLSCKLDGIDYPIPAFIPGLKYEGTYQLSCQGPSFQPALAQHDLFIAQRGEIIRIDLPCRKLAATAVPPLLRDSQPKN